MKQVMCPRCGSDSLLHYTDAYVLRMPMISSDGKLELLTQQTNEYDDTFFDCEVCGYRPSEDEVLASAKGGAS